MAKQSESKGATPTAKGIAIGEKRPLDETLDISPTKKGKQAADVKKKGTLLPPEDKKKDPSKSKSTPSCSVSKVPTLTIVPGEGILANIG